MRLHLLLLERAGVTPLAALATFAVGCGHGQTEPISGKPMPTQTAAASSASVLPSSNGSSSSKESDSGPLSPEALEALRKRADERKLPSKAGEPCPTLGVRSTSKTTAVICGEVGSTSFAVECKGPDGIYSKQGAAACDIRGNAAGDACVLTFAWSMCDGKRMVECKPEGLDPKQPVPVFARGKVVTRICNGPKGCYLEAALGLPGVTSSECDESSVSR